ncbi:unnamed protein product [Soboliphyme baturini]|uniref:DUF3677 domain-containing protein n=1 Tax=Soboliphyme baturini TaxID=241478 RepID=A0A183IF87_9BILA|nr:unnamed protein product [Soboliphyme baturini]
MDENTDPEKARKMICGAVKLLHENRSKQPDPLLSTVLCYVSREKPSLFDNDNVLQALISLLRKPPVSKTATSRQYPLVPGVICSILLATLADKNSWPESIVHAYLDDSMNDRLWVDQNETASLVRNIQTAFGTEFPPAGFIDNIYADLRSSTDQPTTALPSISQTAEDEDNRSRDSTESATFKSDSAATCDVAAAASDKVRMTTRFQHCSEELHDYTTRLLGELCARRADAASRSLLKTLTACCGLDEVRLLASQKLDGWLQNTKASIYSFLHRIHCD